MTIELNVSARIVGEDFDDARKQLFNLFGVELFPRPVTTALQRDPEITAAVKKLIEDSPKVSETVTLPPNSAEIVASLTPAKRARRTKAQIEADRQREEAGKLAKTDPSDFGMSDEHDQDNATETGLDDEFDLLGDAGEPSPPRVIVLADMMDAGRAVMEKKGVTGLGSILQKHGFKKVAEIPEHAYAAVMADLEEAVS